MTFQHRAGVRPYPSPCGFAESCVFGKQSLGPFRCDPLQLGEQVPSPEGALLLPKLRSHFAEFLNNASPVGLRILSSSTCVGLRYGPLLHDSGFSRQEGAAASLLCFAPHHAFVSCRTDFPILRLLRLHRAFHSQLCFPSRVPAVLITRGAGIFYLLSIGYASLPLLRPRLTQSRSALLWKPWIFGRKDSHLALATHSGILSS